MERFPDVRIKNVTLTAIERKEITRLIGETTYPDPVKEAEAYVLNAQMLSARLPDRIRRELLSFQVDGSRLGGPLLRNVPVGSIPPTPGHADQGVGIHLAAARSLSIIVAVIGEQFGFRPEL